MGGVSCKHTRIKTNKNQTVPGASLNAAISASLKTLRKSSSYDIYYIALHECGDQTRKQTKQQEFCLIIDKYKATKKLLIVSPEESMLSAELHSSQSSESYAKTETNGLDNFQPEEQYGENLSMTLRNLKIDWNSLQPCMSDSCFLTSYLPMNSCSLFESQPVMKLIANVSGEMFTSQVPRLIGTVLVPVVCCYAFFDLDELQNVIYDLEIIEIPLGFENFKFSMSNEETVGMLGNVPKMKTISDINEYDKKPMVVVSEFGQKFICSLPKILARKTRNESKSNLTVNLVSDVIAASFYVQNCIRRNTGWWTYELCYNKHVKQFHMEGSKITGSVISLGYYKNNSNVNLSKHKSEERPYFEQIYDDGTVCDVIEKSRTARVWYMCDDLLSTSEAYIAEVDEPSSCEYIVKVKTGSLCKLDAFLSDNKPRDSISIACQPLLEQKAAEEYLQRLFNEKQQKKEAREKSALLVAQADSIQRQRYARKRLTVITPGGIKEADSAEKELKIAYEEMMRLITKLNLDFSKVKVDVHFIYDDLHEMETHYTTEADEDRANIYWYFKDPYWDRKFFPVTLSYARAKNSYYTIMSEFLKRFGEEYDEEETSLSKFLQNIEEEVVTEAHLSMMIGSLRIAFHEGVFPDILDDVDKPESSFLRLIWFDVAKQLETLQLFEYKVLKLLNRKIIFTPEDMMSHIARQMLWLRTLIEKTDHETAHKINFIVVEKLFLKFAQSYNRAVLRFDKNSWGHFLKRDPIESFRLFEKQHMFNARIEELKPENAHLFYNDTESWKNDKEADEETSIYEDSEETHRTMSQEEKAARRRMLQRAKRKNLRKKMEHYLRSRKTANKSKSDGVIFSDNLDGLRKQLLVFKNTLEEKLRETGLVQGTEVKVQLLSPVGNVIAGGVAGVSDERLNAVLKAFFLEQDSVNDEENRYDRLARGYTYGADEEGRERVRRNGDDDDDDFKSSILPILKRVLP